MIILVFLVSLIPLGGLFWWLRTYRKEEAFRELSDKAFKKGVLCVFPVVLVSAVTTVLLHLTGFQNTNPLLYQALHNFFVLAFAEELVKYLAFYRLLKQNDYLWSLADAAALMSIVGIGFGMIESVIYAIGSSPAEMLVRGVCMPHAGYGFIMGYFYGKARDQQKPWLKWVGFGLAWLMHGLYDFGLKDEFVAVNENLMFVSLILALLDIVLAVWLVVFVRKARREQKVFDREGEKQ